ncbi:MAG: hypothetical protein ACO1OQ_04725 [Rufibacter sp.]
MKRLLWLILLIGTITLTIGKTGLLVLFKARQPEIASRYCEQRQEPNNHCKGKCYLRKQLKKETQRESQQTNLEKKTVHDLQLPVGKTEVTKLLFLLVQSDFIAQFLLGRYASPLQAIFHPPRQLA